MRLWGTFFVSAVFWRAAQNGTRATSPQHNQLSIARYLPNVNNYIKSIIFEWGHWGWVECGLRSLTRRKRGFRMTAKRCQFRDWHGEGAWKKVRGGPALSKPESVGHPGLPRSAESGPSACMENPEGDGSSPLRTAFSPPAWEQEPRENSKKELARACQSQSPLPCFSGTRVRARAR